MDKVNELVLLGKTIVEIDANIDNSIITFTDKYGKKYRMEHHNQCCENVSLEDITGDLADLMNSEILVAEERTHGVEVIDEYGSSDDCQMYTFYWFQTIKGSVCLRWYGSSNGYYSVDVSLYEVRG